MLALRRGKYTSSKIYSGKKALLSKVQKMKVMRRNDDAGRYAAGIKNIEIESSAQFKNMTLVPK
ncbi:MAG: hypothetical protein ABIT96_01375 [Ferruginibacter sp.]